MEEYRAEGPFLLLLYMTLNSVHITCRSPLHWNIWLCRRSASVTSCPPCVPPDNRFRYNPRQIKISDPQVLLHTGYSICSLPDVVPTMTHVRSRHRPGSTLPGRQHTLDMRTIDLISMVSKMATHHERRHVSILWCSNYRTHRLVCYGIRSQSRPNMN